MSTILRLSEATENIQLWLIATIALTKNLCTVTDSSLFFLSLYLYCLEIFHHNSSTLIAEISVFFINFSWDCVYDHKLNNVSVNGSCLQPSLPILSSTLMQSEFITSYISGAPEGNWIALKGLICGKLLFAHRNQSPCTDAYLYSLRYISHRFSLFIFQCIFSFMQMTSWFVWQQTEVIDCSVKYAAGRCQPLSRCMRIKGRAQRLGEFPGNERRFAFIQSPQGTPRYSHAQHVFHSYMGLFVGYRVHLRLLAGQKGRCFFIEVAETSLDCSRCNGGSTQDLLIFIFVSAYVILTNGKRKYSNVQLHGQCESHNGKC